MRATVTSKGQITIPLPIRRKLKLHPGTVLEFDERADHLKATKRVDPARMRSVVGIAKKELAGSELSLSPPNSNPRNLPGAFSRNTAANAVHASISSLTS